MQIERLYAYAFILHFACTRLFVSLANFIIYYHLLFSNLLLFRSSFGAQFGTNGEVMRIKHEKERSSQSLLMASL